MNWSEKNIFFCITRMKLSKRSAVWRNREEDKFEKVMTMHDWRNHLFNNYLIYSSIEKKLTFIWAVKEKNNCYRGFDAKSTFLHDDNNKWR